ncbi:MAG: beta-lactamase family protein [Treponema sp.]|nr:beta-lactamase family protein [Treponema sp.]
MIKLETASPEELGISSEKLLEFLLYLEDRKLCMHNILVLRHGKIVMEANYPPFTGNTLHRMYSVTKSFVSIAIGFMIAEGKLTLQSRMAEFFPEYLTEPVHQFKKEMTVRDLLMMATPYDQTTYTRYDRNWTQTFYTAAPSHTAGAAFNYDTSGTVALTALVEKLSGLNLIEYLRPRLFEPLGFSPGVRCIERPEGGAWGGSGLMCSSCDLARFGLFLLNRGKWEGRQLLPASYLTEACSPLIDTRVTNANTEMQFGYGYQIWRTRNNGFCAWGIGTQLALCLPDKDVLLVTTGDTQSVAAGQDIVLYAFFKLVYNFIQNETTPQNSDSLLTLRNKLTRLEFPAVEGKTSSANQINYSGKKYYFENNAMKLKWVIFDFLQDEAAMKYENATGIHEIRFGLGKYTEGTFPETHYFDSRIGTPCNRGYRCKASGSWFNPQSLTFYVYIIDNYFGLLKVNCCFENNRMTLSMSKNAEWFLDEYTGMATGTAEPKL